MGFFDRVERRLERTVNGVFARAFKAEVQPVEIASAIRKAMDDRAVTPSRGHVLVPNIFTVSLSDTDYQRLSEFEDDVIEQLIVSAEQHVEDQAYSPAGPIQVGLERTGDLETGFFRIRPSKAKRADRGRSDSGRPPAPDPSDAAPEPLAGAPAAAAVTRGAGARGAGARDASARGAGARDAGARAERAEQPVRTKEPAGARDDEDGFNPYGRNPYDDDHAEVERAGAAGSASQRGQSQRTPSPYGPRTVAPRRARAGDRPYLASRDDRFLLMGAINVIGRDDSGDIIFDDPGISRRHSEIRITTDGPHLNATVRDLGSTNGTFVNGERISSQRLQDGDRVTFGRTTVVYNAGRS